MVVGVTIVADIMYIRTSSRVVLVSESDLLPSSKPVAPFSRRPLSLLGHRNPSVGFFWDCWQSRLAACTSTECNIRSIEDSNGRSLARWGRGIRSVERPRF